MSSSENKTPISQSEPINQFSQTKIHSANISKTPAWYQDKLLQWLLEGNFQNFKYFIKCEIIDMNYFYAAPYNGTLLDIACRTRATDEFVKVILQNDVDVNVINKITGKAAIHEAIENSAVDLVDVLIQHYCNTDLEDRCGNTPLHSAIKRNDLQIIKLLLERKNGRERIDINISNRHNPTPLHIALLEGYTEAAILLVRCWYVDLDLQTDSEGLTCRQIIQQKYPTLNEKTMTKSIIDGENPAKILFSLLSRGETEKFIELASKMSTEFLEDDQQNCPKFLEYACSSGYADVVDMLLAKGVNPNITDTDFERSAPILKTAENGYYDIFVKLLNHPKIELHISEAGTPLHSIIYSMSIPCNRNNRQRRQCLELLLNKVVPQGGLDIDYMDGKGCTALHRAVLFNDEHLIKSLIYTGAHLYLKNSKGKVPLTSIKANILEDYLDDCISLKAESVFARRRSVEIIFDYTVFINPSKLHKPNGLETEFFTIIERVPELRKLLKHPVSVSFLYFKWHLVRKYYYINFIFYLIFCFMLSWYIFKIHQGTWSPFFNDLPTQSTSSANNDYTLHYGPSPSIIMILLGILVLRELSQFCVSPKSYIKSLENWMEILVILTTGGLLAFVNETNADERSSISACVIVVSWMELTFLLGRYPTFSNYIEMFKMVAFNFFKYLSVYLLLIISFAFSFYILFKNQTQLSDTLLKNQTNIKNESTIEFWQDPKLSFLKSIIMLTGEFSAETIPLGTTFSIRHLFFIVFIFLITIVLYNLLNGLAISDIQAIREDAELVALVSLVKLISQLELLAISSTCLYVSHLVSSCFLHFEAWLCDISKPCAYFYITLFSRVTMYPDTRIHVQPYSENLIGCVCENRNLDSIWSNLKMPSSIVKQAMQILENRNEFDAVGGTADSLQVPAVKKHPLRFQSIDKLGQHLTAQIRDLEIKMDEKVTRKDEKLIQNVSKLMADFESKIDKIENLMESMIKEFKKQNE